MSDAGGAIREAAALAAQGRPADAVRWLERHSDAGDATALYALALWRLEGRVVARNPALARSELKRAAGQGQMQAARTLGALLAGGIGGPADWSGALALLSAWAERDPQARRQLALIAAMDLNASGDPARLPEPEVLSSDPYVARFAHLFTAAECAWLAELAGPRFKPASIFHEGRQRFVADPLRNSETASFPFVAEWPAVHALNRRLAAASGTQVRQGETLQVLRYGPGQEYRPHLDAMPALANQRVLTFLVYLNAAYAGGETDFPELGLRVGGRAGTGLLFANALPDGRPDPRTRHAGRPVTSGTKLAASRWIRAAPPSDPDSDFGRHEVEAR